MDELSLEQLAYESKELTQLLATQGAKDAFQEMEQAIIRAWKAAKTVEDRETQWFKLQALADWQQKLRALSQRNLPTD